jgi:AcrR family transcriptional regulator
MIVSMSAERLDRVLDAAYACFTRHGVRRTTMDDIAVAAGISRPAVYQYVRNKDDAFRRLTRRLLDGVLAAARRGPGEPGSLADRLYAVLAPKLELTLTLYRDSPHAAELLGSDARVAADLVAEFDEAMRALLVAALAGAAERGEVVLGPGGSTSARPADVAGPAGDPAADVAEVALALTRGLEADPSDAERARQRLRLGICLLVAGLSPAGSPAGGSGRPAHRSTTHRRTS